MDEYERLEEDLQKLYDAYLIKFRNLSFLETQLEEQNKVEQDKVEVTTLVGICFCLSSPFHVSLCCNWMNHEKKSSDEMLSTASCAVAVSMSFTISNNYQSLGLGLCSCLDYPMWPNHLGIYLFIFPLLTSHQVCHSSLSLQVYFSSSIFFQ